MTDSTAAGDDAVDATPASPDAELTAALARAQGKFPPIEKKHTAQVTSSKGNYSYEYADLADVLAGVRPVLSEEGIAVVQRTVVGAAGVQLVTELKHVGGGVLESVVDIGQASSNPQQFGAALTYLRRYELVMLAGVAAEQDLDAATVETAQAAQPAPLPPWAKGADHGVVQAALRELAKIVGRDRAAAIAKAITDKAPGAGFPAIAALAVGVVAATVIDELDPGALELAAEVRAGKAAAAAQDAAAEAPDAPAPEPDAQAAVDAAAAAGVETADLDLPAPSEEEPELEEPPPGALDAQDAIDPDAKAPGTVPAPELTDNAVTDSEALRALGCICTGSPLTPPYDDACPIVGHGIPF